MTLQAGPVLTGANIIRLCGQWLTSQSGWIRGVKMPKFLSEVRLCTLDKRLTIRLDNDRFDELDRMSKREGFSVSTIVRHLVYRYIEQQRRFTVAKG